jgi:hypothetical protein
MNPTRFGTLPALERRMLACALAGCLTVLATLAVAQEHGGASTGHEGSDHVDPGDDHDGNTGRGLGPRWQGGGSAGERGSHEDGGETGDDYAGDHESGEDHAEGKRGPRYMGGRSTETILTGRHSVSLEDRVFRGHGN